MLETLVSVREYLSTAYHPDVDYVDGHIEERNVGEREHGELQFRITTMLKRQKILVPFLETRLKVSATRYRIPDVCAYDKKPAESVFTQPPVLCIEILSPEDRIHRITKVAQDYLAMGVPTVWLLDPLEKKAYVADAVAGLHEVMGQIAAADGRVVFSLEEIFSDADVW
jgi:Uma2 family endonuclease